MIPDSYRRSTRDDLIEECLELHEISGAMHRLYARVGDRLDMLNLGANHANVRADFRAHLDAMDELKRQLMALKKPHLEYQLERRAQQQRRRAG